MPQEPLHHAYAKSEAAGVSVEELGAMGTGALRKAAKDGNYEEGSFCVDRLPAWSTSAKAHVKSLTTWSMAPSTS